MCGTCKVDILVQYSLWLDFVRIVSTVILQNLPTLHCTGHTYKSVCNRFNSLLTLRTLIFDACPCSNVTTDFSSFLSYYPAFSYCIPNYLFRNKIKTKNHLPLPKMGFRTKTHAAMDPEGFSANKRFHDSLPVDLHRPIRLIVVDDLEM